MSVMLILLLHYKMWCLAVLVVVFHSCEFATAYRAAVVEHNPITADTPENTILKNLYEYQRHVKNSKSQNVDIIVFPEYGLTTMVEDPAEFSIEINDDNPLVRNLSALAKQNQIYVVVNLLEKVEKSKKVAYYNTNLVFDRKGNVITKYHKISLFGEPNLTPGSTNQNLSFTTDFGVTFGIFTCFDILYRNPSRTVLDNNEITDIVYPTSWFSTMPFYASLTVQHGYSVSTGVNLLASNLNEPQNTHGGSGIYFADGKAKIYINDVQQSKVIIQDVPKRNRREDKTICPTTLRNSPASHEPSISNMSRYVTLRDFHASDYTFKKIDLSQKHIESKICYNNFCCNFDIQIKKPQANPSDIYKLMAFDGIVPFDVSTAHIRVCSLLACGNDSNESCGTRIETSTKFTKITVNGNLERDATTFYAPVTLNYYLRPMVQTIYCDRNNATDSSFVQLSTTAPNRNVIAFGLFGRTDAGV